MRLRLDLFQIAESYKLDAWKIRRLLQPADLYQEPAGLAGSWHMAVAVLPASLGGMGVILWVTANWSSLGRFGQFALLQTLVLAAGLGAATRPFLRTPLGLLTFLGIGGLFAYFGQTYQTGADARQFFALGPRLDSPSAWGDAATCSGPPGVWWQ